MSWIRKLLSFYDTGDRPTANLMTVLEEQGRYKILLAALRDTELDRLLGEPGPLTIFAPTDAAFARVPKLEDLLADRMRLESVLMHHVCIGQFDRTALKGIAELRPLDGRCIATAGGHAALRDAQLVQPDLRAWNGIAHGIDRLLVRETPSPSWLREAGETVKEDLRAGTLQAAKWVRHSAEKVERALTKSS